MEVVLLNECIFTKQFDVQRLNSRLRKIIKIYIFNFLMLVPVVFGGFYCLVCLFLCLCSSARDQSIEQGKVKIRELHSNSLLFAFFGSVFAFSEPRRLKCGDIQVFILTSSWQIEMP